MSKQNRGEFRIPDEVTEFIELKKKKIKKEMVYDSKEEIEEEYYRRLICDDLPVVLRTLVFNSQRPEVAKLVPYIYCRLIADESAHPDKKDKIEYNNKKFIKFLKKFWEDDEIGEEIMLFPIIVADILAAIAKQKAQDKSLDPDKDIDYDVDDIVDISMSIMKKKMKKLTKEGVDKELAFDCLSIVPTSSVLERGMYRMRKLMVCLYTHAKTEKIDFEPITKYVVGKKYYPSLITFLLLEKKQEYVNYTEEQKDFFNKVTDWCINTLEGMEKTAIRQIFLAYFKYRKNDAAVGKDSNRRYFLSSIPESDFPNIVKVLTKMKAEDPSIETYM